MGDNRWPRNNLLYLITIVVVLGLIAAYSSDVDVRGYGGLSFNEVVDQALTGNICRLVESADGTSVAYYTTCTEGSPATGRVGKSPQISLAAYLQQEQALRFQ